MSRCEEMNATIRKWNTNPHLQQVVRSMAAYLGIDLTA